MCSSRRRFVRTSVALAGATIGGVLHQSQPALAAAITGWRWCKRCQGIWQAQLTSRCPNPVTSNGPHILENSGSYVLYTGGGGRLSTVLADV